MKRLPRPLNFIERSIFAAVDKKGALTEGAADLLFRKRVPRNERVRAFRKLEGLGKIKPKRSPGGGTVWVKREPHEPQAPKDDKREPREGCVWRNNQWESADPSLLKSFTCMTWPNLVVASRGKEICFKNGRACTSDLALVALVEGAHGYEMQILPDDVAVETKEPDQPATFAIHP
jgi:hypothetical protein